MNNTQLERYSRHILLNEIGVDGQQKLLSSKVLIIGAGGLGSPAAMYLAAAGVGTIGIADNDKVSLSNLQRQIIHTTDRVSEDKTLSAKETINKLNPDVTVNIHNVFVSSDNIADIIKDYDFVIDAVDNFEAKFLINDACVLSKKAFSHAGVVQFGGQLMTVVPGKSVCYRCIFKEPPATDCFQSCSQAGILGAVAGVIGTLQAVEAVKYILNIGELLTGCLLTYDGLKAEFRKVKLPEKVSDCPTCNKLQSNF